MAESQKRAEVLARANAAMAKTVSRLADQPDIRHFVGQALEVFAQEFNAVGAELWSRVSPKAEELAVALSFERGMGVILGAGEDGNRINGAETVAKDVTRCQMVQKRLIHYYRSDEIASSPSFALFRERLLAQSVRTIIAIPVYLHDRYLGTVCLRLNYDHTLNQVEEKLAFALANQMALALHLTNLAEEAKQAAVSLERENTVQIKATELIQVNEVLKKTMGSLISGAPIDQVVRNVMVTMNDMLNTDACTLWLWNRQNMTVRLHMIVQAGSQPQMADDTDHPVKGIDHPMDLCRSVERKLELERVPVIVDDIPNCDSITPENQKIWAQIGAKQLLYVPMVAGDQVIGTFLFRSKIRRNHTCQQLDLIQALTAQATLSIQMMRLAEEAKQTALAREEESTAQERAAKLARANAVLRTSLETLTGPECLSEFMGHVLLAIARQMDADSAAVWLYDWEAGLSHLMFVVEDGKTKKATESRHPNARRPHVLKQEGDRTMPGLHTASSRPRITLIEDEPAFGEEHRAYFHSLGVRALLSVPMLHHGENLGIFTIRLKNEMRLAEDEAELIQGLANQATLALQMSRLAEQAKQAAVLSERARIAGEIHDSLAQAFAGISLHLEAAFSAKRKGKKENSGFLQNARRMAAFGLAEARSSVLTLKPNVIDQGDFSGMLRQLAERSSVKGHLKCEFVESGDPVVVGKELKHAAFRIVQEALGNALKHAQPKKIRFTLHYMEDHFSVSLEDDGIGFTTTEIKHGLGLRGMRERCEERGGKFEIKTEPGRGTTLTVTFPITAG